jgi:hypothetical protein
MTEEKKDSEIDEQGELDELAKQVLDSKEPLDDEEQPDDSIDETSIEDEPLVKDSAEQPKANMVSEEDYKKLQREFTKKSQRLAELEKGGVEEKKKPVDNEQLLNEFVANPEEFLDKRIEQAVEKRTRSIKIDNWKKEHSDYREMEEDMKDVLDEYPGLVNVPPEQALEIAYNMAKTKRSSNHLNMTVEQKKQQAEIAKGNAFVEGTQKTKDVPVKKGLTEEDIWNMPLDKFNKFKARLQRENEE